MKRKGPNNGDLLCSFCGKNKDEIKGHQEKPILYQSNSIPSPGV